MADVVNLRRLCRACERIVSIPSPSEEELRRLETYSKAFKELLAKVEKTKHSCESDPTWSNIIEDDEIVSLNRKALLFESFTPSLPRHKPAASSPPSTSIPVSAHDERSAAAREEINNSTAKEAVHDDLTALEDSLRRREEEEEEEARARNQGARSRFDELMKSSSLGSKTMAEQLERLQREKEQDTTDLLGLVDKLKQRVINTNEVIQKDTLQIESVGKKVDENRSFVEKMSLQLDVSLSSSTYSCKMCTLGVGLVLALWFFAYLVMRIFPKVK